MSEITELSERVTRVETILEQDAASRHERQEDLDRTLTDIRLAVDGMRSELQRYRGFVGGVALILSVLWAGVTTFRDAIGRMFR